MYGRLSENALSEQPPRAGKQQSVFFALAHTSFKHKLFWVVLARVGRFALPLPRAFWER